MKKETLFDVYPACAWALFTLGACELALVLTRPLYALFACLACGSLFVISANYFDHNSKLNKTRVILLATLVFVLLTIIYKSVVWLDSTPELVAVSALSVFFFCGSALITARVLPGS